MFGMFTFTDTLTPKVMQRAVHIRTPSEDGPPQDPSQRETPNTDDSYVVVAHYCAWNDCVV
jgi:hypothetical protein